MIHASLFTGIGGFDLAAEWMGWENAFHCEKNEFCKKVLKYYWPNAKCYEDITKTDFTIWRGRIDVLTGGFPCQPYSVAGKQLGTEDERHLWPEMLRAIREIKPSWIVGENVRGLVSWNGGLVFEQVQADLEAEGYEVQPFLLPAAGIGAPHKRDRVWVVAYSDGSKQRNNIGTNSKTSNEVWGKKEGDVPSEFCSIRIASNSKNTRQQTRFKGPGKVKSWGGSGRMGPPTNWEQFPTQSPVRKRNDGFPNRMVRYITEELYEKISNTSKENRIKNLQEVWEKVQSKEVWEKIRGLYSLESKEILFQTMQLYTTGYKSQIQLSPFSQDFCRPIMQHLRKHREFRCSPQGQELEKQRSQKLRDTMSFLPHEVALAARRFETAIAKFESWHTNESIKAYGNAIVPQVALQIFKAIEYFLNDNYK